MVNDSINKPSTLLENPWRNAYWFSRMLINGDKYGAVGKEGKLLTEMALSLRKVVEDKSLKDEVKINLSHKVLAELIQKRFLKKTGKSDRIDLFLVDLTKKLQSIEDVSKPSSRYSS